MTIEDRLKNHINSRYSSVNEFCVMSGIANSTIQTVFKRGIKNTSSKTIFKICNALSLDVNALYAGEIKNSASKRKRSSDPVDVIEYIAKMENMSLTYKGDELTEEQKKRIVHGSRIAVEMSITES